MVLPLDKFELFKPSFQVSTKIPMDQWRQIKKYPIGVCMDNLFNWGEGRISEPSTVCVPAYRGVPLFGSIWGFCGA